MRSQKALTTFALLFLFALSLLAFPTQAKASPQHQADRWCGAMSEAENWGFPFSNTDNYHWTVNGSSFVTQSTIDQVDVVLDGLNNDNIAQTMILFLRADQVEVGPNCAGQFMEFMGLGNIDGPRADNGFAWLMVYDHEANTLSVNYAVGGSLNSLHASWLQDMKRLVPVKYVETQSLDHTLLYLVNEFNAYARQQYEPYHPEETTSAQPSSGTGISFLGLLCLVLIVLIGLVVLLWLLQKAGIDLSGPGSGGGSYTHRGNSSPSSGRPSRPSPTRRTGGGSGDGTRVG